MKLHCLLSIALVGALVGCGSGAGDPAVCREPPPLSCTVDNVSGVDVFSDQGCEGAIDSYWCGVEAQAVAECLQHAEICVPLGSSRAAVSALLAASACADEFAEWADCFANGEGGDDSDGDFDE